MSQKEMTFMQMNSLYIWREHFTKKIMIIYAKNLRLPLYPNSHRYQEEHFALYQEYGVDISDITNDKNKIDYIKKAVCKELEIVNLHVNKSKTEEYKMKQNGN